MAVGGFIILVFLIAAGAGSWVYKATGFENDPDKTVLDPSQAEIRPPKPAKEESTFLRLIGCSGPLSCIDNFFTNVTMLAIWLATRLKFLF